MEDCRFPQVFEGERSCPLIHRFRRCKYLYIFLNSVAFFPSFSCSMSMVRVLWWELCYILHDLLWSGLVLMVLDVGELELSAIEWHSRGSEESTECIGCTWMESTLLNLLYSLCSNIYLRNHICRKLEKEKSVLKRIECAERKGDDTKFKGSCTFILP